MYNVIVPTYNERENIRTLLLMLCEVLGSEGEPFRIVVVDDNSPDETCDVVRAMDLQNVHVVQREKKLGLGTAYRAALEHCDYPFTVVMDADLSHDPRYIRDMIEMQKKGADVVAGTRYCGGGVYGWSLRRKIISHGANNVARIALGISNSDVTGSYRLYRTEVFRLLVEKSVSTGYSFQMELLYLAVRHGFAVAECPIVFHDRMKGSSKLSGMEILLYLRTVAVLFFTM